VGSPRIAVVPFPEPGIIGSVEAGGGDVTEPEEADGLVWTNPGDPSGLKEALVTSPARWVQLPFAGIEEFVAAGVLDPARTWTCTKGIYGYACAEHALALMLAAARDLRWHARATTWRGGGLGSPERLLRGAQVLILGAGGIGRELVRLLGPFEVETTVVSRSGREVEGASAARRVDDVDDLLPAAAFVVLALALTPATRRLIDRRRLSLMRPDAWLVNVARGAHVDTDALVAALEERSIGGAALDVTDPEPLPEGHRLWTLDNALITSHVANTWDMALPELRAMVERNVAAFAAGEELEGLVDVDLGY
jgi:phosphoglycerate dehydrogenase-like enzyme